MNSEFQRCIDNRKLVSFKTTPDMIKKELNIAAYDLKRAKDSLRDDDAKWATVQGYYAMFHTARALIFKQGYREKSHRCLLVAIQELYVAKGKLPIEYVDSFREAMDLREDADYGFIYSKQSAHNIIKAASKFFEYANTILRSSNGTRC